MYYTENELFSGPKGKGLFPFSRGTLRAMLKTGIFPQPVKVSPRRNAWRAEDIAAYQERIAADAQRRAEAVVVLVQAPSETTQGVTA